MRSSWKWHGVLSGCVAAVVACGSVAQARDDEAIQGASRATGQGGIQAVLRPGHSALIESWVAGHLGELVAEYRHLHAHPELSNQERETAAGVAAQLEAAGYEVARGVGGHGVVGVLRNGRGPTVMIRGDMDALPIREETGLPYASVPRAVQGSASSLAATPERARPESLGSEPAGELALPAMHACGHDIHTTGLVGSARLLASPAVRAQWRGTLLVVAQPAEEVGEGARNMIADGLFERFPKPDFALALHVDAALPAGQLQTVPGWARANVDSIDITVHGRSGHGARPHQAVDPVVVASHLVIALQTLVSRRVDPLDPAVVTVGTIHGGTKRSQIPDRVELGLTVRSYSDASRKLLLDGIRQLAADVCQAFQCPKPPDVREKEFYTPSLYNDPELDAAIVEVLRAALGPENISRGRPAMGGEDFGRYSRELGIPSALLFLGSVDPATFRASQLPGAEPLPSLHSSRYAPEPRATLRTGVRVFSHLALALFAAP